MGTRNLTCVYVDGQYKVAQCGQWDGYPSGQGLVILAFLQNQIHKGTLKNFADKCRKLEEIAEDELEQCWVDAGASPNSDYVDMDISAKFKKAHPELNRDVAAEILDLINNDSEPLKLKLDLDFAADSLFCEWAYVIDFDRNTFEVFKGFNKNKLNDSERFSFLAEENSEYSPVRNVAVFSLDDLPDERVFLKLEYEDEDEDRRG